jgi:hypothetical protein
MIQSLLRIAKTVLFAVALFFVFGDFGGFSERQSLVLSLTVTALYSILRSIEGFPHAPFHMTLTPNLDAIATDFDLVENTEEAWTKFLEEVSKLPSGNPWYACVENFSFSLSFLSRGLIYDNSGKRFMTEIDLKATLEPMTMRWAKHKRYSPRLHFNGTTLSIELDEQHWEKIRTKEAFDFVNREGWWSVEPHEVTRWVLVKLAVIHFSEFGDYSVQLFRSHKRRKAMRARYGWKETDDFDVVEHKYCTLSHSAL